MSEGSTPRAETGARGSVTDRPARIQELRDAVGDEAAPAGPGPVALDERPGLGSVAEEPGSTPSSVVAPVAPEEPPRSGRGGIVFVAVAAVVLLALGGFFVFGRSSGGDPAVATGPTTIPAATIGGQLEDAAATHRTEDLCRSAEIYSIDDLLQLAKNMVEAPDTFLAAYETMLVNSPADLRALLDPMGPLTRKAVAEVKAGRLTTDVQVQAWLAASPAAELEAWVGPQQALAPKLATLCP